MGTSKITLIQCLILFFSDCVSLVAFRAFPRCSQSSHCREINRCSSSRAFVSMNELRAIPIKTGSTTFFDNEEDKPLIPEENPTADPTIKSLSGVSYMQVLKALNSLYPPQDLEKRNAASRSDGYWPYVNDGKDPPKQYTYGEFDFFFFAQLLDKAHGYYYKQHENPPDTWDDRVFADIGSGTGRLVLAAAALHPGWRLCRGLEVLESINDIAAETLEKCRIQEDAFDNDDETEWRPPLSSGYEYSTKVGDSEWLSQLQNQFGQQSGSGRNNDELEESSAFDDFDTSQAIIEDSSAENHDENGQDTDGDNANNEEVNDLPVYCLPAPHESGNFDVETTKLRLAPIEFSCGSFDDPYEYFGDVDCAFCFSSCMSQELMSKLSRSIGRKCKPGTIVITTEYMLPLNGIIEPLEDDKDMPSGPYKLELLEKVDGWCWLMGGQSTAYVHKVVKSLWQEGVGKRKRPELSLEERAFRVVMALEAGELTDTKKFLSQVHNNCIFYGLPESWRPKLDEL